MTAMLDWQCLLFVPVGADRHLESAIRHRPDAVILDLEDAIAPDGKQKARQALARFQARLAEAGIDCAVRVNSPLGMMAADIQAVDPATAQALILPKCEGRRQIENAVELAGGDIGIIALVETPRGVEGTALLADTPGLAGLMLGSEDLSAALGVHPDRGVLEWPAARLAMAAAGRGLLAIGFPGSIANFRDLELYRRQIERARHLGMNAVAAIHPAQIPVIREALAPDESEAAWARKVLSCLEASAGGPVFALDGLMIDAPVIARARRIVARAG